jgi:hypothetical protein
MYVSEETREQTEQRLRAVVASAELVWWPGAYAFHEHQAARFPIEDIGEALALVRDEDVWSVLKPAGGDSAEPFGLFSFHFPDRLDNSGFVGWLASRLKRELGTGVFVVCGQNSRRGGIFDYWGVPVAMKDETKSLLARLRNEGQN